MATNFQANITQGMQPSQADPSGAIAASRADANVKANTLTGLGSLAADAVQGFITEGFRHEQERAFEPLQREMENVKMLDIEAKTLFAPESDDPAEVKGFQERMAALAQARDDMPARAEEMKMRSNVLLKQYIARYPGLADKFRAVSQEITGLRGLDMYDVQNLFSEVDFIAKQREQQAAAFAKQDEEMRRAFVNDLKDELGETGAIEAYNSTPRAQRLDLVLSKQQIAQAKKSTEEAIKQGGKALLNTVGNAKISYEGQLVGEMSKLYARLEKLGVTRAALMTNEVPEAVANSPGYKGLLVEANNSMMKLLDAQYQEGLAALRTGAISPADAEYKNKAIDELRAWYNSSREFLIKNGPTSALMALATADESAFKTFGARLTEINKLVTGLELPPTLAAILEAGPESAQWNAVAQQYPSLARKWQVIERLRRSAARGDSDDAFMAIVRELDSMKANPMQPLVEADGTSSANREAAFALRIQTAAEQVREMAIGTKPIDVAALTSILGPATADDELMTVFQQNILPNLERIMPKMSEPDRADLLSAVKRTVNERVFGVDGFGDIAKNQLLKGTKAFPTVRHTFTASAGDGPLEVQLLSRTSPLASGRAFGYGEKETNKALKMVDQALRVQAAITKEPIANLRKAFIDAFNKEGSVSDAIAATLATGLGAGSGAPLGGVVPMGPVRTEAQMREAVRGLPEVPQSELDEADRVLREALKRTDLSPAARKQIEERLAK